MRRSGLTFAPEAATPRLRAVINKWIRRRRAVRGHGEAFKRGWEHVKLYFMIGLPTETDEDVEAIAGPVPAAAVARARRINRRARDLHRRLDIRAETVHAVPVGGADRVWTKSDRKQQILQKGSAETPASSSAATNRNQRSSKACWPAADQRAADVIEAAFRKRRPARLVVGVAQLSARGWTPSKRPAIDVEEALARARPRRPPAVGPHRRASEQRLAARRARPRHRHAGNSRLPVRPVPPVRRPRARARAVHRDVGDVQGGGERAGRPGACPACRRPSSRRRSSDCGSGSAGSTRRASCRTSK